MRYRTGSQCNDLRSGTEQEKRGDRVTCQPIVYTLKFHYVIESNIMIKIIAVVKSTANKNNCNSFGDSKRHIICIATSEIEMTCFVKQIGLHIKVTLQAFSYMILV